MRKLLGTVTLAALLFAGVGMFRGWFSVSRNSESDKTKIELNIDKAKLKEDAGRLKGGIQDFSNGLNSDANPSDDPPVAPDAPVLPPDLNQRF